MMARIRYTFVHLQGQTCTRLKVLVVHTIFVILICFHLTNCFGKEKCSWLSFKNKVADETSSKRISPYEWWILWKFVLEFCGNSLELFEDVWLEGSYFWEFLRILCKFFGNSIGILLEFFWNSLGILNCILIQSCQCGMKWCKL